MTILGLHSPLPCFTGNAPTPIPYGHGSLSWSRLPTQLLLRPFVGAGEAGHGYQGHGSCFLR